MRKKLLTFVALVALLLMSSASFASSLPITHEQLIEETEGIIIGIVTDKYCAWAADSSTIYTYVNVEVVEQIQGELSEKTIVMQMEGGRVGKRFVKIYGNPEPEVGDRALIYTISGENGLFKFFGLDAGYYPIIEEKIDKGKMSVAEYKRLVRNVLEKCILN